MKLKTIRMITALPLLALALLRIADAKAQTLDDLSPPPPGSEFRRTFDLGLGYGGGNGDLYRSSEAGLLFRMGAGIPVSHHGQFHLLGYLQRIGHTGDGETVSMYGLDFLYGLPYRTVVSGRSQGFFEAGIGFAGNVGYRNSSDVVISLRGGALVPLGEGKALQLGVSVRPSIYVLMNMIGADDPTGVLLGVEAGLVF